MCIAQLSHLELENIWSSGHRHDAIVNLQLLIYLAINFGSLFSRFNLILTDYSVTGLSTRGALMFIRTMT